MLTERLAEAKREALGAQLEAYGLASHLLPAARQEAALPASLDTQARGAHLLSTCRAAQRLHGGAHVADGVDAGEGGTADPSAHIFRGEVAAEMARLEKVLADLAAAGRALLGQWPGHPALQSLHEVCERL